jgi:phosphohistidine swiveling domain-containing protein
MTPSSILPIEAIVPRHAEAFGGKAQQLASLARAGFPIPAARALSADLGRDFLAHALGPHEQPARLLGAPSRDLDEERLGRMREKVLATPLPDATEEALRRVYDTLREAGADAFAVRSSALREDDARASAAGIHTTVLGVESFEELIAAVRRCWASALTPTALAYYRATKAGPEAAGVGVIVQAMVPAEVSGALFTVHPLSGDRTEMVLNASWGLGTLLMDGRVSPDTFRVDRDGGWIRDRVIGDKGAEAVWRTGEGIVERPVAEARRREPSLDDATVARLVALGERVEAHFGGPRDIEWALSDGELFLMQARPVTALPDRARRSSRRRSKRDRRAFVWSNVNVGEALPGVATPLTWSVLSGFSDRGFRRAFGALGCKVPKDAELVGSFRGRIYLNLTDFMDIASQVPGLDPRTLLSWGGGGGLESLEAQHRSRGTRGFLLRLPRTLVRYLRENFRLTERVRRFEQDFADERGRLAAIDFRILSSSGLDRVLTRVEKLLDATGLVMLNVYGNLLATVLLLRRVLEQVAGDDAETLERGLLTGLADVESAAPGFALYHLAEMARREPEVAEVLRRADASRLRIEDLPAGPTRRGLERFLVAYGERGAREAEIAEPRWKEDPSLPLATLRGHLLREAPSPLDVARRQRKVREKASADLDRRVAGPLRLAVRHLLGLVQRFMRLRERLRAYTVQVLGLYRAVALDASRRLLALEPGVGEDAAFFLTVEELHGVLRGDVHGVGLLVRRRKLQYERDRALPDPPETFVGFPPPPEPLTADDDVLVGLPASSGVVRGRVRRLERPSDAGRLGPGEILVAPYADVGWSPLFLVAGGVVTNLGGPLSHAAVVAREYGVPAVVNVPRATERLPDGAIVEVDGDAGTVRLVEVSTAFGTVHG